MSSALQKQISKYQEEAEEYTEAMEDSLNAKANFSLAAVGKLMETLSSGVEDLVKANMDKEYYDKELCQTLKDTVSQLVQAFSNVKTPVVNVSTDLSPIKAIADDISSQNKTLMGLIEKMSSGNKTDELYKLIVAMIGKQNSFLDNSLKQVDYSEQLKDIAKGMVRPMIDRIEVIKDKYENLIGLKPIYKT